MIIEQRGGEPTKIFDINDVAFSQIASHAEIDARTARRLQSEYSQEFDALINAIWQKKPAVRMLRTHDIATEQPPVFGGVGLNVPPRSEWNNSEKPNGVLRAFVSDKFKTFDNINLLQSALPQLMENPAAFQVVNADVTDKRLYLRLKSLVQTGTGANVGDHMANGIGLQNSKLARVLFLFIRLRGHWLASTVCKPKIKRGPATLHRPVIPTTGGFCPTRQKMPITKL